MGLKLFVEDLKGYMDVCTGVKRITIEKVNGKNNLKIVYYVDTFKKDEYIPLSEIRLAFLINAETLEEYFRYEK